MDEENQITKDVCKGYMVDTVDSEHDASFSKELIQGLEEKNALWHCNVRRKKTTPLKYYAPNFSCESYSNKVVVPHVY